MANFLSGLLSPALTVATKAAGANVEGKAIGAANERASLLDQLALLRQRHADENRDALTAAQIGNYTSLAEDRSQPPAPRNIDPLSPAGIGASVERAKQLRLVTPKEPTIGEQLRAQKQQEAEDAAEAWWNSDSGGRANAQASAAFRALRAAHPDWKPQRIMLAAKQAVEANAKTNKPPTGGFLPTSATATTEPAFPRPAGWSDEKWNQYLKDTNQAP